jgi:hypothetical protein
MRDHVRIVAVLYLAWAVVQAAMLAAVSARWFEMQPRGGLLWTGWALMLVLVVAFAVVGTLMWRREARVRPVAVGLAIVALMSFPVGTAIGAYSLWVLFRHPPAARAGA